MSRDFLIGVDAGGSKTRVLLGEVIDGRMRPIGSAVGAAGNPRSVGFESALRTIHDTVELAFHDAAISPTLASHACLSVAGAGRPEERQRILDWCMTTRLASHPIIAGDAECLLATEGECGVALIAGTGSMAWGRNAAGKTSRAGGQGFLFDDEGSGYWLAAQALRHVCMAADARRKPTSLLPAVLRHLSLPSADQLIGWCYEAPDPRRQIATLAPLLFQEYAHDAATQKIVRSGAKSLALLIAGVVKELGFTAEGFTLACAGSVLLQQPLYRQLLEEELDRMETTPGKLSLIDDPVEGALELAWKAMQRQPS